MTVDQRAKNITREAILKLLTDAETAKVSTAETAPALQTGAEFLDLEQLNLGIQRFEGASGAGTGNLLPRSAVGAETWGKILGKLSPLGHH